MPLAQTDDSAAAEPVWRRALEQPAAYPGQVDAVDVRETHISWLFFAGERVYKLKKPVDLGFLDYSTPERRRHCCEEEVRLNRRLAPDTYLGVARVTQRVDGTIGFGGDGTVLEWAVEMRRLPADGMLDRILAAGRPPPALIEGIAHTLARFHQTATGGEEVAVHGRPAAIARNLLENFEQTRAAAGDLVPQAQHQFLERHTRCELRQLEPLLHERVRDGHIRDGHGDLHAGNICVTPSGIVIYDCIEFAERLRCGDVACDLAFLVMDLEHSGEWALAAALVDHYRRAARDERLPVLMPLYKGYRAMVRAKVAVIRHGQCGSAEARAEAAAVARGYFDLAAIYALPASLILSCGLPGSGKSWAARHLARATGAVVLSSDRIRRECGEAGTQPNAYGEGQYSLDARQRVYDELLERARNGLESGRHVIVDASFSRADWRAPFVELARNLRRTFVLLERRATDAQVQARMARRAERDGDSEADYAVYLAAKRDFQTADEVEPEHRLEATGALEPDALRALLIERLIALHRSGAARSDGR